MKKKILGTAILTGTLILAACSPNTGANNNTARNNCKDWKKEKHGEEVCTDKSSSYYGHYLFGGALYANRSALVNSSPYKSAISGATTGSKTGSTSKGNNSATSGANTGEGSKGNSNTNANQKGNGGANNNGGLKGGFGSGSKGSGSS